MQRFNELSCLVAANNGHPTAAPTAHAKQHSQKDRCSKKCDVEVSGGEKVEINCKNCKLVGCCNRCCKRDISQPFYPGRRYIVNELEDIHR